MALQYDAAVSKTDFTAALTTNTGISSSTTAAINSLLGLDTAGSLVVAGWNGTGAVVAPVGQTPDVLIINPADGANLALPTGTENTPVIVIDSESGEDVALTIGAPAPSATARLAADATTSATAAVSATASTDTAIAKVVIGGNGNDAITYVGSANVQLDGGAGDDTLTSGYGNDVIIAGTGNNTIVSGAGNDTIVTGLGTDTINAGAGYDTIQVQGNYADFAKSVNGTQVVLQGTGVSVNLTGAELVTFADGQTLSIVETKAEAQALSLYQALLGRDADATGAENFLAAVDNGASLTEIVGGFLNSAEYATNVQTSFLNDIYQDLFGRDASADDTGLNGWLSVFAEGASRSEVAAGIAGSAEAASLSNTAFVEALYQAALDRGTAGDQSSGDWVALLASGASRADVANDIFASAEANTKVDTDFVDSLFTSIGGTDAAKAGYLLALENGASHSDVVVSVIGQADLSVDATHVIVVPGAV